MKRLLLSFLTLALCASGQPRPRKPETLTAAMARGILKAHNAVRYRVGVPPLSWSNELAVSAQAWANHLAARGEFAHTPRPPYGENLFGITSIRATPDQVVREWADEAKIYDYKSNTCSGVCGHYTQVVWATTRRVGCGVARNQRTEIWVCHYDPPGNVNGRRPF